MKKLIFSLLSLLTLSILPMRAQEVYNMMLHNNERIINDPTSTYTNTQIAQFKVTALRYLQRKAMQQDGSVSTDVLDYQAYYMSEFVTLFFKELTKIKKKPIAEQKKLINLFIDASGSNPYFNDPDKATVHIFVTGGSEITPFSLDTDWEKALQAVRSKLR